MKVKIFDALKTKFEGVSEQTLNRIAEKAARTVTEEEQLESYIDGVSFQNVIDSEADYRATRGSQTAIDNYEKKHNIKDGKPIATDSDGGGNDDDGNESDKKDADGIPEWAKTFFDEIGVIREERKKAAEKRTREQIVEKVIELGADKNDRDHIDQIVKLAKIENDANVDDKANEVVAIYNAFKKPSGGSQTPGSSVVSDDDVFSELLKGAMESKE